jgi:hypothetical protein
MNALITNEDDMQGKRVKKISFAYERMAILFSDDTAAVLAATITHDEEIEFEFEKEPTASNLHELGLIDDEEYRKRREELQERVAKIEKERRREIYNVLKAEFEPSSIERTSVSMPFPGLELAR